MMFGFSTLEAKYLKHVGAQMDVKVSVGTMHGEPYIFIRDFAFKTFNEARKCLVRIAEEEMVSDEATHDLDRVA